MPGERIGDAYIRIHADGSGFDREIRKDFDPVIKTAGKNNAKTYVEAFSEEMSRRGPQKAWIKIAADLNRAFGRFDAGSDWIKDFTSRLDAFREKVSKEFGADIGERLADEIREGMQKGFIQTQEDFDNFTKDLRPHIARLTKVIDDENQRALDKMLAEQKKRLQEIERAQAESSQEIISIRQKENLSIIGMLKDRAAAEERLSRQQSEASRKLQEDRDREFDYFNNLVRQLQGVEEEVKRLVTGNEKFGDSLSTVRDRGRDLVNTLKEQNIQSRETEELLSRMRLRLIALAPRVTRVQREFDKLADTVGRFSGRGSRNDFLNFIGSVNRNLVRVSTRGITTFARLFSVAGGFFNQIREGGLDLNDLKTGLKGAFSAAAGGIGTLINLGLVMTLLAGSLGVVSAAISGLAALLTSLAGTVAFAAASALPALLGALFPLAAAVGTVVAAFQGLSDAQKEALKTDLKPLTNSFKDLAKSAADVLFRDVGEWARQLKPVIDSLEPGVRGVARAIRETLGDAIRSASESPQFEHFIDRFNRFLPNAVRKLGTTMTNVFQGIGGVFLAMLPSINRFLRYLRDVTAEFAEWANSRSGRQEIREFFKDALDSAAALGDFLGRVIELVGDLLSAGRGTGDSIFRQMADQVQRLIDYLQDNPEALQDWLEWGKELGEAIGNMIVGVGKLIAALDSPTTRAILTFLLEGFTDILDIIGKYPQLLALLAGPLGAVYALVKTIYDLVKSIGDIDLSDVFSSLVPGGTGFLSTINGIADAIGGLFGGGDKLSFLPDLVPELAATAEKAAAAKSQMQALKDSLDQVTGAATDTTFALARQQLQESGLMAAGRELGFSTRTLVQAFAGQKQALEAIQPSARRLKNMTGEQRLAYGLLLQQLGLNVRALRRERNEVQRNAAETRDYTGKLRGVPKRVRTLIEASNIKPTTKSLAAFIAKARELAPNLKRRDIKTIIAATGAEPTKKKIDAVIAAADKLKKEREARIGADIKAFEAREKRVRQQLQQLENRPPAEPKVGLNDTEARNKAAQLVSYLNGLGPVQPIYIDIVRRYSVQGNPNGPGGTTSSGNQENQRSTGTSDRQITVPQINVYEAADGKATAVEILNRIAATGY